MNRRELLKQLVGGVALAGAVRTFPFRVYSFAPMPVIQPVTLQVETAFPDIASINYFVSEVEKQILEILYRTPAKVPYTEEGIKRYLGPILQNHNMVIIPPSFEDIVQRRIRVKVLPMEVQMIAVEQG